MFRLCRSRFFHQNHKMLTPTIVGAANTTDSSTSREVSLTTSPSTTSASAPPQIAHESERFMGDWSRQRLATTPPRCTLKPTIDPQNRRPETYFFSRKNNTTSTAATMTTVDATPTSTPLFKITSPQCEYYAVRLPMLKGGFRRILDVDPTPCSVVWGRPMRTERDLERLRQRFAVKERAVQELAETLSSSESEEDIKNLETRRMELERARRYLEVQRVSRPCYPWQRFNHYPGSVWELGCKNGMEKNIDRFRRRYGDDAFDLVPRTFRLPEQADEFKSLQLARQDADDTQKKYIVKPSRGSCGRGIFIASAGDAQLTRVLSDDVVVQEYIPDPLLLSAFGERKFDFRIYVAVTSYDPLVAYRYGEGLVRFAAESYYNQTSVEETNKFSQLTNFSVGRRYANHLSSLIVDAGCFPCTASDIPKTALPTLKTSFSNFNSVLSDAHGAEVTRELWRQVDEVIVKTLLCARPNILRNIRNETAVHPDLFHHTCFELYGFDLMFDAKFRPWLLEVNVLPSLESSSDFDYGVKSDVMTDLLNMLLIEPSPSAVRGKDNSDGEKMDSFRRTPESVLLRHRDEYAYRGGFERIFPTRGTIPSLGRYHEVVGAAAGDAAGKGGRPRCEDPELAKRLWDDIMCSN